jgi:hypothetical protein
MVQDHGSKSKILLQHFIGVMGTSVVAATHLKSNFTGMPRVELKHLDEPFSDVELRIRVFEMSGEKAPGDKVLTCQCLQVVD